MNATLHRQPQPLAPLAKRRNVVILYGIALLTLLVSLVTEVKFNSWQHLDKATAPEFPFFIVLSILGMLLTLWSIIHLTNLGLPTLYAQEALQQLDEREQQQLLNAQFKAQRIFTVLVSLLTFAALLAPKQGLHLSWWAVLLAAMILNALIQRLPTAILAWTEPDPIE